MSWERQKATSKSDNEQKAFLKCLDEKSVERYFPKNTNPVLYSITNPINHLMSSQYLHI